MEASTSEDFFTEVLPAFLMFKYLRLSPYLVQGSPGNRQLIQVRTKFFQLVRYVTLPLLVFMFLTAVRSLSYLKSQHLGLYFLFTFQLFSNFGALLPLLVLHERYRDFFKSNFFKVIAVDRTMSKMGINIRYKHMQRMNFVQLMMQGGILILTIGSGVYTKTTLNDAMYFMTFFFRFLAIAGVRTLFRSITVRLQLLNAYIEQRERVDLIPFATISRIFATIQGIHSLTNRFYSVLFLLELAADFSSILAICYKFWGELFVVKTLSTEKIVFFVTWMVYALSEVLSLIYACHTIATSIRDTQWLLFKVTVKDEDHLHKNEITSLTLQLSHNGSSIAAGKFLVLDFSLVFSMMGALSTYLIILIQLDN